ncbi:response regulator transcription factor [Actinomadura miaoliensis]|uniref:Response regulator transcription factor n=1 Tax=Actinomadura miaoliensis TaxID=430685 RepID=A0ABP7WST6_9ACTN
MSGARLLVIEDDPEIGSELVTALTEQGYTASLAGTGGAAVAMVDRRPPELILLDLGLPDVDGVELCSVLRRRLPGTAIVVLTARSQERDVVTALDVGADDYVTKPFRLRELLARTRAQLRRRPQRAEVEALVVGALRLEPEARRAFVGAQEVALRPREFDLLLALASRAGRVVPRAELMREVWGPGWFGDRKTLDVHVSALRRRLAAAGLKSGRIVAVRGRGYGYVAGL